MVLNPEPSSLIYTYFLDFIHHLYMNGTQIGDLYLESRLLFWTSDFHVQLPTLTCRHLKFSNSKTEVSIFPYLWNPFIWNLISVDGNSIFSVARAKNLVVIFDPYSLPFSMHFVSKSCCLHFQNSSGIWSFLPTAIAAALNWTTTISCLAYSNGSPSSYSCFWPCLIMAHFLLGTLPPDNTWLTPSCSSLFSDVSFSVRPNHFLELLSPYSPYGYCQSPLVCFKNFSIFF